MSPIMPNPFCFAKSQLHGALASTCMQIIQSACDLYSNGAKSTLSGKQLKFENIFTYLSSNISSTESDLSRSLVIVLKATNRRLIIWKSYQYDKIKRNFFQTLAMSLLLNGCTLQVMKKCIDKRLDGSY